MQLALLPLQNDNVLRVRSQGPVCQHDASDALLTLLGPLCYSYKVLLCLDESQSIDTSGICWLVSTSKRFAQTGGKLVLFAVPPVVLDVLDFLNLTPLLHIAPNEQTAFEQAKGKDNGVDAEERRIEPAVRFPR